MLTQRKRHRTVEDFNQFCTFVLAYAGYIPYPKEDWWCNDGEPRDGSTHSADHSAWAYLSPPSADDGPSQPGKAKRRKSDQTVPGQREKTPKRCDSGSAKGSPKTKTNFQSLSRELPENLRRSVGPREIGADPESAPTGALQSRMGAVETREPTGARKESHTFGLSQTEGRARGAAREESELTVGGLIENLLKTKCSGQGGGGPERKGESERHWGEGEGRGEREREGESERRWEERGERREREEGSDSRRGNTDVLRLVMDKRLKGVLPYDQETGYHTDMEGSDHEQDPHAGGRNASASSARGRGEPSADHSKMEASDDDSWDLITCFCLKPFAGRPMIECSECATWVHLSCAKIRRTHVPEVFVCQPCRDAKQNIRRSNRPRIPPRKRFSE